jgi:hypothetical protein
LQAPGQTDRSCRFQDRQTDNAVPDRQTDHAVPGQTDRFQDRHCLGHVSPKKYVQKKVTHDPVQGVGHAGLGPLDRIKYVIKKKVRVWRGGGLEGMIRGMVQI